MDAANEIPHHSGTSSITIDCATDTLFLTTQDHNKEQYMFTLQKSDRQDWVVASSHVLTIDSTDFVSDIQYFENKLYLLLDTTKTILVLDTIAGQTLWYAQRPLEVTDGPIRKAFSNPTPSAIAVSKPDQMKIFIPENPTDSLSVDLRLKN